LNAKNPPQGVIIASKFTTIGITPQHIGISSQRQIRLRGLNQIPQIVCGDVPGDYVHGIQPSTG
jgi:hypothetical protein